MKIYNDVKRMTSTGAVSTGTRARISRLLLTQLIASTALVAPFAVGPAFAQSTLGLGSAPTTGSGDNATLSAPGDVSLRFNSDAISNNTFKVQSNVLNPSGGSLDNRDWLVIDSNGNTTFNGLSTFEDRAIVKGNGAAGSTALIVTNQNGEAGISTNGLITGTRGLTVSNTALGGIGLTVSNGATMSGNISNGAAVSIDNLAGPNGANGAVALNLNGDGIQNAGTITGATLNTATLQNTTLTGSTTLSNGSTLTNNGTITGGSVQSNLAGSTNNGTITNTGTINNANGTITGGTINNASIGGTSTINTSGAITGSGGQTFSGGLNNTGALSSTANTTLGSAANSVNTIGNAGTSTNLIRGAANTIQFDANRQIVVDTNGTTVTGATNLKNTLTVAGTSTLNGATTINNTLDVNVGGTALDVNAEGLNLVVSGPAGSSVPASSVSVTQSSVSLLQGGANGITSSGGNTVVTGQSSTRISGGGSSVTVNSSGVNLAGSGGSDLQLNGIADGSAPNSAVNRRQLDNLETEMSGGIASAMAMAQLPDPVPGSNYSVGLGAGFYNGESAFALGGAMYLENGVSLKAAYTYSSEGESGFGLGAGYSW